MLGLKLNHVSKRGYLSVNKARGAIRRPRNGPNRIPFYFRGMSQAHQVPILRERQPPMRNVNPLISDELSGKFKQMSPYKSS